MSDATMIDRARGVAGIMERRELYLHGGTRTQARERLARRLGVLPGTLYNLGRDRLKRLDASLREALSRHAVSDLRAEIGRLTHELEVAQSLGVSPSTSVLEQIKADMARVEALIGEVGNAP